MKKRITIVATVAIVAVLAIAMLTPERAPSVTILLNGKPAAGEEIQMTATQETAVLDDSGIARPKTVRDGNRHFSFRAGPDRIYELQVPEKGNRIYRITATGIQTEHSAALRILQEHNRYHPNRNKAQQIAALNGE